MSSQPSSAHLQAVDIVESHALKTMEAEIKKVVELRPEIFTNTSKNIENTIIEAV